MRRLRAIVKPDTQQPIYLGPSLKRSLSERSKRKSSAASRSHSDLTARSSISLFTQNWPATLRWQTEGIVMMTAERFDKAADFLDQALAASSVA
jgi:hypothetical protein